MEPGHVFIAEAEEANDLNRILGNECDINIEDTDEAFQEALAKAELAAGSLPVGERKRFSEEIAECDDPVPMMQFVEDKNTANYSHSSMGFGSCALVVQVILLTLIIHYKQNQIIINPYRKTDARNIFNGKVQGMA